MNNDNVQEYKGFSLFNDIEDTNLRNRNRAVVLANIATHNSKNRKITHAAGGIILGYYGHIPDVDKVDVKNRFVTEMNLRGFKIVNN